jgi:hypothetical protein
MRMPLSESIICVLQNSQRHTNKPESYLIRSLLIYLCIRFAFILLFIFIFCLCFPQKDELWLKGSVEASYFLRVMLPHSKGDVGKHPSKGGDENETLDISCDIFLKRQNKQ